jgi:hypothetical protein
LPFVRQPKQHGQLEVLLLAVVLLALLPLPLRLLPALPLDQLLLDSFQNLAFLSPLN